MIILPDQHQPKGKFLLPIKRREWLALSERQRIWGPSPSTYWQLTAYTHDRRKVWSGRFDDREDCDAFLYAVAHETIRYERELWRLPTPFWPDLPDGLIYECVTYTTLTTTGGGTNYTVPADWNSSNNTIHAIGAGGSGGAARGGSGNPRNAAGGGGGAYAAQTNVTLTPAASIPYVVGTAGTAIAISTNIATFGNAGTDSTFNTTTVVAKAGGGGEATVSTTDAAGGAGGLASASTGSTKFNGGTGGNATNDSGGWCGTGAGGAGGPGGAGANGTSSATVDTETAGGTGGNGSGGTGGIAGGGAGGNGTDITGSGVGSGGGGGGQIDNAAGATAGTGGNYGAGGGGCACTGVGTTTSGAGNKGVIVVAYTAALYIAWRTQFSEPDFSIKQVTH